VTSVRLPDPSLVVLVGAAGAGKSTWAVEQFGAWRVVAADDLRAVVGLHEHDQRASKDAFDVLARICDARMRRGFTTVIDSTGLEAKRRAEWVALARRRGVPAHAVVFDVAERAVRAQNRGRERPVPSSVVTSQLRAMASVSAASLLDEGFDGAHSPGDVVLVPPRFLDAPAGARRQQEAPMPMTFGLQISRMAWPGGAGALAPTLAGLARAAEDVGFTRIAVMDHLLQIPQVGPEWEDLTEAYTTLGFLAGVTSKASLGAIMTNVGLRNPALLGKMVATLDVLSGGRAFCGLGGGWFEKEEQLYGYPPSTPKERLDRVEAALQLLPRLWAPGEPACYPRPLQDKVPIMVGGGGEKRTLRLVAQHADACNLFGEPDDIAHKVAVLHDHCAAVGRDPAEIEITHFGEAGVLAPGDERDADVVGTVEELVGRYRSLAEVGVTHAVVGLRTDGTPASVEAFAPVIDAFRT
jgi:predicted kinase